MAFPNKDFNEKMVLCSGTYVFKKEELRKKPKKEKKEKRNVTFKFK